MLEVVKSVYKSVGLKVGDAEITFAVDDEVQFTTTEGIMREGIIEDLSGAKSTYITITPVNEKHQEKWNVSDLVDIKLV